MTKPPRLLEDGGTPAALRQDLLRVQRVTADYDSSRGLLNLQKALSTQETATGTSASEPTPCAARRPEVALTDKLTAKMASAPLTKWGLLMLVGLTAVGSVLWQLPGEPARRQRPAQPAERAQPPTTNPTAASRPTDGDTGPDGDTEPGSTTAAASAAAPALPPEEPRATEEPRTSPQSRHRAASGAQAVLRAEIENLKRVRNFLSTGDAASAYRTARAGHRRFGEGVLYEEREALTILALSALGKQTQATRRAQAFAKRFPHSPLRGRLSQTLENSDATDLTPQPREDR